MLAPALGFTRTIACTCKILKRGLEWVMEGDGWWVKDFSHSKEKKGASGNVFILRQENNLQKFKSKKQWWRHMGADCRQSFPLPSETLPLTAGK